jgi:hypothetical protein
MTSASLRKYRDHHDWVVIADGLESTFGTLRAATSYMRTALIAGNKLVMLSMKPRK